MVSGYLRHLIHTYFEGKGRGGVQRTLKQVNFLNLSEKGFAEMPTSLKDPIPVVQNAISLIDRYGDYYLLKEFLLRARKHLKDEHLDKFDNEFEYYLRESTYNSSPSEDLCSPYEFSFKFPENVEILYIENETSVNNNCLTK